MKEETFGYCIVHPHAPNNRDDCVTYQDPQHPAIDPSRLAFHDAMTISYPTRLPVAGCPSHPPAKQNLHGGIHMAHAMINLP